MKLILKRYTVKLAYLLVLTLTLLETTCSQLISADEFMTLPPPVGKPAPRINAHPIAKPHLIAKPHPIAKPLKKPILKKPPTPSSGSSYVSSSTVSVSSSSSSINYGETFATQLYVVSFNIIFIDSYYIIK